jgi:hypothetical protein
MISRSDRSIDIRYLIWVPFLPMLRLLWVVLVWHTNFSDRRVQFFFCIVCSFFYDAVNSSDHMSSDDTMINEYELERYGRKRSWPNLGFFPCICLEALR